MCKVALGLICDFLLFIIIFKQYTVVRLFPIWPQNTQLPVFESFN